MKLLPFLLAFPLAAADLPVRYLELMKEGAAEVSRRLAAEPGADLTALESAPGWRHFPSSILVAAVLHREQRDPGMLKLAVRIGDVLLAAHDDGTYSKRGDHHRDTYMWLEAFRLLERDLDPARRDRWRRAIGENLEYLVKNVAVRLDYPWYQAPFIGTSTNHYALWTSTLYLGGKVLGRPEWEKMAATALRRLAVEQSPDGFWGEHSNAGPTSNYDYLTATGVALYYEHSGDPAALEALRRSVEFHKHYVWPNGITVETLDDRNRHGYVSMWGSFGFSHTPEGRRLAGFLLSRYPAGRLSLELLGRMAQNALYYHEGPSASIPLDRPAFSHRMKSAPAGIRKNGPWFVCLSGIIDTQAPASRFFLDRQAHVAVFHEKLGQIVVGSNSKRQPELATFVEQVAGQTVHMPMSSRLRIDDAGDSLALAYNTFFARIGSRIGDSVEMSVEIVPKGRPAEAAFALQLRLHPGETLETGAGHQVTVGAEPFDLPLEGALRHHGWEIRTGPEVRLRWPVYPFNPYADGPEKSIDHAVGLLSAPVRAGTIPLTISAR